MVRAKWVLAIFCESISIRGMSKIVRSQSRFLRLIWLFFVVAMTGLLIISVTLLIFDYLDYDLSVQTRIHIDKRSPFPAITICHHQPFSNRAYQLWENKSVKSPTDFNRFLRKRGLKDLRRGRITEAQNALFYDSMSIYYQNIPPERTEELGHSVDVFLYCIRNHDEISTIETNCSALENYVIKRLSNHQFFNCYTFEAINEDHANRTDSLGLIVALNYDREKALKYEQGLFMDIFEQAKGLRVIIHPPNVLPDFDRAGVNIEPGKFNELTYEPIHWERLSTPVRPCLPILDGLQIEDLSNVYSYSYRQCLFEKMQKQMVKECKCVFSMWPRVQPHNTLPYCGYLSPESYQDFEKRLNCVSGFFTRNVSPKCLHACNYYEYESSVSVTKWRAENWQLYWTILQNKAFKRLESLSKRNLTFTEHEDYKKLIDYLEREDLTNVTENSTLRLDNDRFTYVLLKKKTGNLIQKTEKLELSLNVLLSRIGGLCSLSIGLTAAFIVEIIEFLYVFHYDKDKRNGNLQTSPSLTGESNNDKLYLQETSTNTLTNIDTPNGRQMPLLTTSLCTNELHNKKRSFLTIQEITSI